MPRQDRSGGFVSFKGSIVQGTNLQKNIVYRRTMWYNIFIKKKKKDENGTKKTYICWIFG